MNPMVKSFHHCLELVQLYYLQLKGIMKEMWDKRYSAEEYAYGTEPNAFFKETIEKLNIKGRIILPAEGEGRNAVFAAEKGLEVFAFDISKEGKKKALRLAEKKNVEITYEVRDFYSLDLINLEYDAAALIFAHFPQDVRTSHHHIVASLIKPNGYVILEGFSKNNLELRQSNPQVGGPGNIDLLFSKEDIRKDFSNFKVIQLEEKEVELFEGKFHKGIGSVIRFIGKKSN